MKKMVAVLLSVMMLFSVATGTSLTAKAAEFAVTDTVESKVLHLEVKNIPIVHQKQMLSILLVKKNAQVESVAAEDIAYSKSIYLNGKDSITVDMDVEGLRIYDYRLVIRDSHEQVNFSKDYEINVKSIDLIGLKKIVTNLRAATETEKALYDLNNDGVLDDLDLVAMRAWFVA